jgi:putative transposase
VSLVQELAEVLPFRRACAVLGLARASVYRWRRLPDRPAQPRQPLRPDRSLSQAERNQIRAVLNSPEYMDLPPRAVYARLLDSGIYLASWRTMYRILAEHGEVRERRAVRPPRSYVRPQLVARGPRQAWSWDITKLRGLAKGQFFYLYVILDLFSRYVVGWMVAERESADLARQLVSETAAKEGIQPGSAPMTSTAMAELLEELGIAKSHSRPRVSDDNPFSEAQFKTVKYRPDYPGSFRDLAHTLDWGSSAIGWYNHKHHHSALALLTPAMVHAGQAETVLAARQATLDQAFQAHPERFPGGRPLAGRLPAEVWINQPALDLEPHADPPPASPGPAPQALHLPTQPSAQPGSRAGTVPSRARRQRTVDAGEHSATPTPPRPQEVLLQLQ